MRACSTTRFPSEFHPSRRSFRPHLARRCTRVLVEHIAPSTPHHLTKKKRKNPNFDDDDGKANPSASTETRLESRPAMASVLFCSISLARKKTTTHHLFSSSSRPNDNGLYRSTIFVERELLLLSRERQRGGHKGLKNI